MVEKLSKLKPIKFSFCSDKDVNNALKKFNLFFRQVKFSNDHEVASIKRINSKCILIYTDNEIWITPVVELSNVD